MEHILVPSARGWFKALRRPKAETYEPEWTDTPFGQLIRGMFWEADGRCRKERRLGLVWTQLHYILGGLTVILAALAGVGGLTEVFGHTVAGAVSLAAAAAAALATFLKTDEMREDHQTLTVEWDSLRDDLTVLWETRPQPPTGSPPVDPEGWRDVVQALQTRAKDLRCGDVKKWPKLKWDGHS